MTEDLKDPAVIWKAIGALEKTVKAEHQRFDRLDEHLKKEFGALDDRLDTFEERQLTLMDSVAKAKGGWRVLVWIGGAVGGVVAAFNGIPWIGKHLGG